MMRGTGPSPARSAKYLGRVLPVGNEKSAAEPACLASAAAEHPQRLGLGGLGRLEEEAAGSGGERPGAGRSCPGDAAR